MDMNLLPMMLQQVFRKIHLSQLQKRIYYGQLKNLFLYQKAKILLLVSNFVTSKNQFN